MTIIIGRQKQEKEEVKEGKIEVDIQILRNNPKQRM